MLTSRFHYELPDGAIAQEPAEPRDSSRLLVVPGLQDRYFRDLPDLLDPGDLVVVNRTRVRAARLYGRKDPGGGRVEVLLLRRRGERWEALVRPARRVRPGIRLEFAGFGAVVRRGPDAGVIDLVFDVSADDLEERLDAVGEVPLPPYFTGTLADPGRYQTMFATSLGSAAAPTAGLHFTPSVVERLAGRAVALTEVDLVVGLDTFRPIAGETLDDHRMHTEEYSIPLETATAVAAARRRGGRVVAIGTTVVRALESAAAGAGEVEPGSGTTDLFIRPGFDFRVVDRLVTNFHVPGSTLVVLVAAFVGEVWRSAYTTALERGYRFLSFGDAMLADRVAPA